MDGRAAHRGLALPRLSLRQSARGRLEGLPWSSACGKSAVGRLGGQAAVGAGVGLGAPPAMGNARALRTAVTGWVGVLACVVSELGCSPCSVVPLFKCSCHSHHVGAPSRGPALAQGTVSVPATLWPELADGEAFELLPTWGHGWRAHGRQPVRV